jgi:hypothetical protein
VLDGEEERFYLGGPEAAELAHQTLLEIRRKHWRGHDHYWHYRRSIKVGLALARAFTRCICEPTGKNMERLAALSKLSAELQPKDEWHERK